MELYFFTEGRFLTCNDKLFSEAGLGDLIWERYLSVFSKVHVVARHKECESSEKVLTPINSPNVDIIPLPYYIGPFQYLKCRHELRKILKSIVKKGSAYICRVPGNIGSNVIDFLQKENVPYALEIVGDPAEALSSKSLNGNPLSPFLVWTGIRSLKKAIKKALAVLYVTKNTLQKKYPANQNAFTISVSDVFLPDERFAQPEENSTLKDSDKVKLLCVGSLAQMYKAPDVVLQSIKILSDKGRNVHLTWCGGGRYLDDMKILAKELGISDKIDFMGDVNADGVFKQLICADIFIQASRTEGLPRAVIEAMAAGLPIIGTNVGGIPELVDKRMLIPTEDSESLADAVIQLIDNTRLFNELKKANYIHALNFKKELLDKKRAEFFNKICELSSCKI